MPEMISPSKNSENYSEITKMRFSRQERHRRSNLNFNTYLTLLSKGYDPNQALNHMQIKNKDVRLHMMTRMSKTIRRYQTRKAEELVFIAEIRHSHVYKSALEEFEKSKIDQKTGKQRPGNPVYLQVANESLRDLRKLLGLDKSNGDIVNNGNMAVFNWDSLHVGKSSVPQSLPNVPQSISSSQELAKIDATEERIRQLERLAAEKKLENDKLVEEYGEPIDDHDDSLPVEEVKRTIVLKATSKEKMVSVNTSSLDDLIG